MYFIVKLKFIIQSNLLILNFINCFNFWLIMMKKLVSCFFINFSNFVIYLTMLLYFKQIFHFDFLMLYSHSIYLWYVESFILKIALYFLLIYYFDYVFLIYFLFLYKYMYLRKFNVKFTLIDILFSLSWRFLFS